MAEKIGLDTPVVIYFLEADERYIRQVRSVIDGIESGKYEAIFSSLGLVEVLTGPKREGQFDLANQYKELISHFPHLTLAGLDEAIIEIASDLRAKYRIDTPDAIHLATAIDFGVTKFITNDRELLKVKELKVELLQ